MASTNSLPSSSLVQNEIELVAGYNSARRVVEKKFNDYSHVPVVSTVSGAVRAIAGAAYMVASLIIMGASTVRGFFTPNTSEYKELRDTQAAYWELQAEHGLFNIVRGVIEAVPLVGNGIMLAWDWQFKQLVGDQLLPPETYP